MTVDYVERVDALAPTIAKLADQGERDRRLPAELVDALHDAGLFRLLLPRALGGAEVDPATFVRVTEAVARIDASTAWVLGQTGVCAMSAAYLTPEVARDVFGPPRAVLAWGAGPVGRAVPVDGGYRVTGTWGFASGGRHATWLGGHSTISEADGTPRRDANGEPEMRTMLFPASTVAWQDVWDVIGLRGTGSDTYSVTDAFVRADHSLTAEVARLRAGLESARAYLFATLDELQRAVESQGDLDMAQRMTIRLAATSAIHRAVEVADRVYHAAGAHAIFAGGAWERRFRDIHAAAQQVQGRDDHYENVGRFMLGLPPDTTFI